MKDELNGHYAKYNNKEYRIGKRKNDEINLISNDSEDLKYGFDDITHPQNPQLILRKTVKKSEIEKVYHYRTYWIYQDHKLTARGPVKEGYLELVTNNPPTDEFERIDKYGYSLKVPVSELEMVVEKKEVSDYFERFK